MPKTSTKTTKHKKKPDPFMRAIMSTTIILGSTFLVMYVVINGLASQLVPSIFTRIVEGEKNAIISFYTIARDNEIDHDLFNFVSTDRAQYADELSSDHKNRKEFISYYESLLQINPYARDVLYALSVLYEQEENASQAQAYLQRARALDPSMGK